MYSDEELYRKEFKQLLGQLEESICQQKETIQKLKAENQKLKEKLKSLHEGQTDIFSALTDKERILLKNQIQGFIDKIEYYLNHQDYEG